MSKQIKPNVVHVSTGTEFEIVKQIIGNRPACWGPASIQKISITMNPGDATIGFHDFVKSYIDDSDTVGLYEIPQGEAPAQEFPERIEG